MKVYIFCYSNNGCRLAQNISKLFNDCECITTKKLADKYGFFGEASVCSKAAEVFNNAKAMIFIGACGIAVRTIAPLIKNKAVDPPVIVIDDCGQNVISLLSGHIGGANDLAVYVASMIKANPVITTATDVNNRFSVDSWAVKNNLKIGSLRVAKDISARILDMNVKLKSDLVIKGSLPDGLEFGIDGDMGIYVSNKIFNPFGETLHLFPRNLYIGIGCKKEKPMNDIEKLLLSVLKQRGLSAMSIGGIASIDIKSNEQGILDLAEKYDVPLYFYNAEELNELCGEFTKSNFVRSVTGVDNVCERAACMASGNENILIRKVSEDGVTIAICEKELEVVF